MQKHYEKKRIEILEHKRERCRQKEFAALSGSSNVRGYVSRNENKNLAKLPGVSSLADFGFETGSARRRGLDMKARKKALESSIYDNTCPIIGLEEQNSLPYFIVYLKTVFYLPIVSWNLSQSCKFLFPLSKILSPLPPILLCYVRAKGSTVPFAIFEEIAVH